MTLAQLIAVLERARPDREVRIGFSAVCRCWGTTEWSVVKFRRACGPMTVGAVLGWARSAGRHEEDRCRDVAILARNVCDENPPGLHEGIHMITPHLLAYMSGFSLQKVERIIAEVAR